MRLLNTSQFIQIVDSLRSVIVTGPPGSGKSQCVDVYAETQRQLGVHVTTEKVIK